MARTLMGRQRKADEPYMVFVWQDWTWRVLKSWQADDSKPYARWFCDVTSPYTMGGSDLGDTYVADIVNTARLVYIDPMLTKAGYAPPQTVPFNPGT